MRILQVIDVGYEAGGAEKIVRTIRDGMVQLGHDVFILSTDKNMAAKESFADATVPSVTGTAPSRLLKYFWNNRTYQLVRSAVSTFDPDVVHFHTICEFSPAVIWGIGDVPSILTVHGPEEFTLKLLPWLLPPGDYNEASYRWRDIRLVGRLRYAYLRFIQRPAYLLALRRIRLITVPSKYMAGAVAGDFRRTPIEVVYPAVISAVEFLPPRPPRPTVLFVGRLEAVKGVRHLIRAFALVYAKYRNCTLRIVGDGGQRGELEGLVERLGLGEAVEFAGWLRSAELHYEYGKASILAIPSVWPEALGLVGLEALSNGVPIVGSDIGGIPELIDGGVTGTVVRPGDERRLAEALEDFLFDERKLGSAARASTVKARSFSVEAFIERQLKLYEHVVGMAPVD